MDQKRQASPWIHSAAAFGGAIFSTTLTHPLDLVKARFQVQHVNKQLDGKVVYRSTIQAFGLIYKQEGVAGLYRGVIPNLCGNGAAWAAYMLFYSWLKIWDAGSDSSKTEPPTSLKRCESFFVFRLHLCNIITALVSLPLLEQDQRV